MGHRVLSTYSYILDDGMGFIAYSAATGNIVTVPNCDAIQLNARIALDNSDDDLCKLLNDKGILVSEDCDEFEYVHENARRVVEDDSLLLMILPTEQCNFRCAYCYEDFKHGKMGQAVQDALIAFVEKNIKSYSSVHVEWFGGEPLIAIDVIQFLSSRLIKLCNEHKKPYIAMMTTNGYNLTPDVFQKMKHCRIVEYQISIDGFADTHDKLRVRADGSGTWAVIINNLRWIRDNTKSRAFRIIFRTNLTKLIYEHIDEFLEFYLSEFGYDKRFSFFLHNVMDWGNMPKPETKEKFCSDDDFYSVIEKMRGIGISSNTFRHMLQPGSRICYAAKDNFHMVMPDGRVGKCSLRLSEENNFTWNVLAFAEIEKDTLHGRAIDKLDAQCVVCKKLPLCFGLICPYYDGAITEACGYDISRIEDMIRYAAKTSDRITVFGGE